MWLWLRINDNTYFPPPSWVNDPSITGVLVIVFTVGIWERMSLTSSLVIYPSWSKSYLKTLTQIISHQN